MGSERSLDLRIADAYPSDIPKGWCRLHPLTMEELDVSPGDSIEVTHNRGTVGSYCYPADRRGHSSNEAGRNDIHIGLASLLDNPGLDLTGQMATVQRISAPAAETVVYEAPPTGTHPEVNDLVSNENLVGTLAAAGAKMAVYGRRNSGIQGLMLKVYATTPDGIVKIAEDTSLDQLSREGDNEPSPG